MAQVPFINLSPCCLKGSVLPGEPRGVMEPATATRKIARYHASPSSGDRVDPKKCIVLFPDAFGLGIPNPKIQADRFADMLGLDVYAVDYIPVAVDPSVLDPIIDFEPNEHANRSWLPWLLDVAKALWVMLPKVWWLVDGTVVPRSKTAVEELRAEGYTSIGGIGYCRGGSMVAHLLGTPLLDCGVILHPAPDKAVWPKIDKPSSWHLADHDMMFKAKDIDELKSTLGERMGANFDCTVYKETVHGFAGRPKLEHEPTRKAFEASHEAAVDFFSKRLVQS